MTALTLDQVQSTIIEAGRATAEGNDSIVHFAKIIFMATRAKLIDEKSVTDAYKLYLENANASKFGRKAALDDKTIRFGAAKVRTFVKFAARNGRSSDVWSLIPRTVSIINREAGKLPVSNFEALLKVVRYANKVDKAGLTDQEISTALAPEPKEVDEVFKLLNALVTRVNAAAKSEQTAFVLHSARFQEIAALCEKHRDEYKAHFVENDAQQDEPEADDLDLSPDNLAEMLAA